MSVRELARLPKAHLHLHLQAGMRPGTLADLGQKYGVGVPANPEFGALEDWAGVGEALVGVLRDKDDWERFADELCEDHVSAGAVYVEPSFYAAPHGERFGDERRCWEFVLDTFAKAAARHDIEIGFMVAADRVLHTPEDALELARMAVSLKPAGVVSFGLHNQELDHPGAPFVAAFRYAKEHGLLITPHAGEFAGADSVMEAVDVLGADRIQHGIRAVEDPDVLAQLARQQICLDVCPTSNWRLGVVPDLESHPLRRILDAGVPCSINGDDPLMFSSPLLGEYELCRETLGLDDDHLAQIAKSSIQASAASPELKARAAKDIDQWLAE
jgi:adenosine deaminase